LEKLSALQSDQKALEASNNAMLMEKASTLSSWHETKGRLEAQVTQLTLERQTLQMRTSEVERLLVIANESKDNHQVTAEELELARENFVSLEASYV
jgi:hypothetical protein